MSNKFTAYYPLFFVVGYLLLCLSVSVAGPIEYVGFRKWLVTGYIFAILAMFSYGYCLGIKVAVPISPNLSADRLQRFTRRLFDICFYLAVASVFILFIRAALSGSLSLDITQSGQAYIAGYEDYERNTGTYSLDFLLASFFAFPTYVATIWGLFFYKELSGRQKKLIIFMISATILIFTISGGKQKQFGDYLIYFLTLFFIRSVLNNGFSIKAAIKILIISFVGVMVLLSILSFRYAAAGVDIQNLNSVIHPLTYFNENHISAKLLGDHIGFAFGMFSGYLGQGFFGLSLSMEQDFTWSAFGGSSYSWSVILNRFIGTPFLVEESYPYVVGDKTGWSQSKWHSVFAWLASDFTFTGTVLLNGVIGFVFGRLWKEILLFSNPYSILLFTLMCVGAFYAPANNQLLHSPGGLFTFVLTVWVYFLFRSRYNYHAAEAARQRSRPTFQGSLV